PLVAQMGHSNTSISNCKRHSEKLAPTGSLVEVNRVSPRPDQSVTDSPATPCSYCDGSVEYGRSLCNSPARLSLSLAQSRYNLLQAVYDFRCRWISPEVSLKRLAYRSSSNTIVSNYGNIFTMLGEIRYAILDVEKN